MLEEPYELIAHVRLCGEVDRVTGRLYPELGQNRAAFLSDFSVLSAVLPVKLHVSRRMYLTIFTHVYLKMRRC